MFSVAGRRLGWAVSLILLGLLALTAVMAFLATTPAWTGRLTVGAPEFWVEDVKRAVDLSDEDAGRVFAAEEGAPARPGRYAGRTGVTRGSPRQTGWAGVGRSALCPPCVERGEIQFDPVSCVTPFLALEPFWAPKEG